MARHKQDRWKEICERFIRAVDPGFAEPCYLVTRREAEAAGIIGYGPYLGLTNIGFSGDLRALLERQHRWVGRGFAAIVDLPAITSTRALESDCLHEFAHHAELATEATPIATVMGRTAFDMALSEPRDNLGIEQAEPTRDALQEMHGPAFIRLCLHLEHRAIRLCDKWPYIVDPPTYGLPAKFAFRGALGGEPWRLVDLPLSVVAATPPPETYQAFTAALLAAQHHL